MPDAPLPHPGVKVLITLAGTHPLGLGEQTFHMDYMRVWRIYDLMWQNDVAARILREGRKPRDRCGKPGVTS